MGQMGYGYGSECHLLRWLGRHRNLLNQRVATEIKCDPQAIEWIDFHFDPHAKWQDAELTGLEFLPDTEHFNSIRTEWDQRWPYPNRSTTRPWKGNQNWDAVAEAKIGSKQEWILVEAKAELKELTSNCKAKDESRQRIAAELDCAKQRLQVQTENDWMKNYYQLANRLALLSFLNEKGLSARLLLIYFVGDLNSSTRKSPRTKEGWTKALEKQFNYIGEIKNQDILNRIHKLFLPVAE